MSRCVVTSEQEQPVTKSAVPTFHLKAWCPNGHVMVVTDPSCPECVAQRAQVAKQLIGRLDLDLIDALEGDEPLIGNRHSELDLQRFGFKP